MKKSSFKNDLEKEKELSLFLDGLYRKHLKYNSFTRENNISQQLRGVDVIFTNIKTKKRHSVDEKAQLDYLNDNLPTFAFELSYKKDGKRREGWLFDSSKKTQFYSLITAIYSDVPGVFTSAKITLVNRKSIIKFLNERGISKDNITLPKEHGKHVLEPLNPKDEGYLFFSRDNKAEQPLNLILRLEFLIAIGVAKTLV